MEQIITIIIQQIAIWGPSLVAVLGVVAAVVAALSKLTIAIADTKSAIAEMKQDPAMRELAEEVRKKVAQDEKIIALEKALLDKGVAIRGYADYILAEIEKEKEE